MKNIGLIIVAYIITSLLISFIFGRQNAIKEFQEGDTGKGLLILAGLGLGTSIVYRFIK